MQALIAEGINQVLVTVCEDTSGKTSFRISYAIIPRAKGGVYVPATAEIGEAAPLTGAPREPEQAAAKMFDASIKVLEPR